MAKFASDLLLNIRRRAQLSNDSGQALNDTDLLIMASDELQNVIAPHIYAFRGWQYATQTTFNLTTERAYRIPSRAAGGTIISVEIVDTPINRPVPLIHPLQAKDYGERYYLYANNIVLTAGAPSSGQMVVRYLMVPNTITTIQAQLTSFNTGIATYLNSTLPSNTALFDISYGQSPYEIVAAAVPGFIDVPGAGQITLALTTDAAFSLYKTTDGMTIADLQAIATAQNSVGTPLLITAAGTSGSPQLNDEFHDYLAQRTAMRAMEAIGHTEDLTNMAKKLQDLDAAFMKAIAPRARGDFKVIATEDYFYDRRY